VIGRVSATARRLLGRAAPGTGELATSPEDRRIIERALPYTTTGPVRLQALIDGVRHVVRRDLPGALAECGVWRGGGALAMLLTLQEIGVADRDVHLFATGDEDALRLLRSTGYPPERLHLVHGRVEDTLPAQAPARMALLRLDTASYESTRHELEQLYPRLVDGGLLLIEDYGRGDGCRRAVDEYFASQAPAILLHRIDRAARMAVKH
jgi:O-methyltransferase